LVAIGIMATLAVLTATFRVEREAPTVQQAADQLSEPVEVTTGEGEGEEMTEIQIEAVR